MKTTRLTIPLFAAVLVLGLAACQTPRVASTPEASSKTTVPVTNAHPEKSGTQLWAENCIRCHNLRPPASYSDAEWEVAMHHMRIRANLTAEEHRKILEFIQAAN